MSFTKNTLQIPNALDLHEPKPTERFFSSVKKKVEEATIRTGTRTESKELIRMITDMQYQAERTAIILGTKGEQQEFLDRIESLLVNPGEYDAKQLKQNLQAIIAEELTKGITRARMLNLSLGVDLVKPSDVEFNYPMVDVNTTLVPMELHLAFYPDDTVQTALNRLQGQYASRGFNGVILLKTDKTYQGMITIASLRSSLESNPELKLGEIPLDIADRYGTLQTPKADIESTMLELGVNIFPIVETENLALIGILTHENISMTDVRYYTQTLKTQIGESLLKKEIETGKSAEPPTAIA